MNLSQKVKDLLNRLGLSGLSSPVGDIVATAGQDVKKRPDAGLLTDLSPEVAALLASLDLGGLSPPVGAVVATAGQDV
ncbi:hypothetical protein KCU64_g1205, partial [Aureobasidium melanogenum]